MVDQVRFTQGWRWLFLSCTHTERERHRERAVTDEIAFGALSYLVCGLWALDRSRRVIIPSVLPATAVRDAQDSAQPGTNVA